MKITASMMLPAMWGNRAHEGVQRETEKTAQREEGHQVMKFEDLTEEQKAKALKCTTPQELLELAKEEGYELSDDELQEVSGGWNPGDCKRVGDGW